MCYTNSRESLLCECESSTFTPVATHFPFLSSIVLDLGIEGPVDSNNDYYKKG